MSIYDPRSKQGMYSRGSNTYNGISKTPNPVGLNQHKFNPQKAAKLRKKHQAKKMNSIQMAAMMKMSMMKGKM